jgi:hypothetical protein
VQIHAHHRRGVAYKLVCIPVLACALGCTGERPRDSGTSPAAAADYSMVEVKDVSFGRVKRVSARIVIPPGHTREEVKTMLEHAARGLAERTNADAVMVFAYRPQDNVQGIFTVGRTTYAPDGEWSNAGRGGSMAAVTDLNDLYFNPPKRQHAAGDTVVLADSLLGKVTISNDYGEWGDANVVARVRKGTKAIILEARSEAIGNYEFVRYRVRTTGPGKRATGWVHDSDTHSARN